jgi:hypothetical protein
LRGSRLLAIGVACLTIPTGVPAIFIGFAWSASRSTSTWHISGSWSDDTHEALNIATMAMIAMSGFLVGPPLIGFVAGGGLRVALLWAFFPGLCVAFWLTRIFPTLESTTIRANPFRVKAVAASSRSELQPSTPALGMTL